MRPWRREHDLPGTSTQVNAWSPGVGARPSVRDASLPLQDLINHCKKGLHLKAVGSHWALSTAAISDDVFIETHDPTGVDPAMHRTLYDVVPGCLDGALLDHLVSQQQPQFGAPHSELFDSLYFVHIETGKRIYQLYAELDQGDDSVRSLASILRDHHNDSYMGPWAFRTLGGAGGQTVFGALTTGTHGGDFLMPPIADDVVAMHLVADGGKHYWIEPSVGRIPFTDEAKLRQLYGSADYGGPGNFDVIHNDDIFNAVLVSVGRFGVVYSVVLRAVRQYSLHEERRLTTWQEIRDRIRRPNSDLYKRSDSDPNRFLQVAVCLTPHLNFQKNLAGVTRRWNSPPTPNASAPLGRAERVGKRGPDDPTSSVRQFEFAGNSHSYSFDPNDPNKPGSPSFLENACANADFLDGLLQAVCEEIRKLIEDNKVASGGSLAAVAAAGGTGAGLLALAAPLAGILAALLAFLAKRRASGKGQRQGEVMNELSAELLNRSDPAERAAGLLAWQMIGYVAFAFLQKEHDFDAISYAVMDVHDYLDKSCNVNVDSIEVFFDATSSELLAFVDSLIAYEIRQEFQGRAFVGYASLRFTGKTRALIGMQRWPLTCAVEIAGLKDASGTSPLIDFAISQSRNRNFGGILHWGQRNESNRDDIEFRFGDRNDPRNGNLGTWRDSLAAITDGGRLDGLSSRFTRDTGLEVV